jgi:hypothetical protein
VQPNDPDSLPSPGRRPLVGRDRIVAELDRSVADAIDGRGGVVLLTGEPGIGKTAVAMDAVIRAERHRVRTLWAAAWDGGGAPDYWPWIQVFRSIASDRSRRGVGAEDGLPDLIGRIGDPEYDHATDPAAGRGEADPAEARFQLFDDAASALFARARDKPIVVVLDDLQWADAPSLGLLEFIARRIRAEPLLVIGTYRDAGVEAGDASRDLLARVARSGLVLPLPALPVADVARLMAEVLGVRPSAAAAAAVQRRTGGNPFFVQQVARLLPASVDPLDPGGTPVPLEVREAIERRLVRLSRDCREVLAAAAIVGSTFSPGLVAQVSDRPVSDVARLLTEAARAGLVTGTGTAIDEARFVHDLIRETIRDGMEPARGAMLHLAAARALEARRAVGGHATLTGIADHFVRASGLGAGEDALRYAVLAARDAGARSAYDEAARHWQYAVRALDALDSPHPSDVPARVELLLGLADAQRRAGDPRARGSYIAAANAARRTGDPQGFARAALGVRSIGSRSWPPDETVVPLLEEALGLLDGSRSADGAAVEVRLLAALARELVWNGQDIERGRELSRRAVEAARGQADAALLADSLVASHNVVWGPGNAGERLAIVAEIAGLAAGLADRELRLEMRLLRAADLLEIADPAFRAEVDRLADEAGILRLPRFRYEAMARRATVALLDGAFDRAELFIEEAAALGREIGEPDAANIRQVQLWDLRSAQGRRHDLLDLVRELYPDTSPLRWWYEALIRLEAGDTRGAATIVRRSASEPPTGTPRNRAWLSFVAPGVDLLAPLGLRRECAEMYEALLPYAGTTVVVGAAIVFQGAVDHYLGRLASVTGRPVEARAHLAHAVALHEALRARPWALRSRFELADLMLADQAAREEALAQLAEVAAEAAALGMAELSRAAGDRARAAAAAPVPVASFRREGAAWAVDYAGTVARLDDARGMHDLAILLGRPGVPVHAAELVALAGAGDIARADLATGAGPVLDEQAIREIRDRLADIDAEIAEADRWVDPERAHAARAERDALVEALSAATGLAGRRRKLGDPSERARKAVQARIRDVLSRMDAVHPALAAHLRTSITTGTYCTYSPPAAVAWRL